MCKLVAQVLWIFSCMKQMVAMMILNTRHSITARHYALFD